MISATGFCFGSLCLGGFEHGFSLGGFCLLGCSFSGVCNSTGRSWGGWSSQDPIHCRFQHPLMMRTVITQWHDHGETFIVSLWIFGLFPKCLSSSHELQWSLLCHVLRFPLAFVLPFHFSCYSITWYFAKPEWKVSQEHRILLHDNFFKK